MFNPSCITRRLYVTNIQSEIEEAQIRAVFGTLGKIVGCKIVEDPVREDRKAAFVTYENKSAVVIALEKKDDLIVKGERWTLAVAPSKKHQLFVGGYDLNVTHKQLLTFFSSYGEVEYLTMKYNFKGVSRCFAFLTYIDSPDAAKFLVSKRFVECFGKIVEIKWAIPPCVKNLTQVNKFMNLPRFLVKIDSEENNTPQTEVTKQISRYLSTEATNKLKKKETKK
jgi:RNA recognition motif-containing protein